VFLFLGYRYLLASSSKADVKRRDETVFQKPADQNIVQKPAEVPSVKVPDADKIPDEASSQKASESKEIPADVLSKVSDVSVQEKDATLTVGDQVRLVPYVCRERGNLFQAVCLLEGCLPVNCTAYYQT